MNPKKAAYLQELQLSRLAIARDLREVRDEFNVAKKVEKVIRRKPLAWLAGAGLGGFLLATWRRPAARAKVAREEKTHRSKGSASSAGVAAPAAKLGFFGMLLAIFKLVFPLARPLLSAYASRRLAEMAMNLQNPR
jgi:hypothetical protein